MKNIFLILLTAVTVTSCFKKEEPKLQKEEPSFQKIGYSRNTYYMDSLPKKIIPDKEYKYWAYMSYRQMAGEGKHIVLKQGGDTLLSKNITTDPGSQGFFMGCHPNYCCNYVVVIENEEVRFIKTEAGFRDFLGTIDNLEEAILLARTFGYSIDIDIEGSAYRIKENAYELHLMEFHEYPPQKESIEIKITKDGYMKTKSLGVYCKGQKCY